MTVLKRISWPFWMVSIILGIVVPILLYGSSISGLWRSGVIYGLLYSVTAGLIGHVIKRHGDGWWRLLVLPVLFALGILMSGPRYALYFAPMYLCISYLAYGLSAMEGM